MIDFSNRGRRCRARRMIRSHAALVPPLAAGTITYEIENLDRRLILVQWDQGPATYAFNEDLEIIGELEAVG